MVRKPLVRRHQTRLEPISKSPEQYSDGGKLHKAEEIIGVIFPSTEESTLPLNPGEEALHQPAPFITTHSTAILRLGINPSPSMWRDHFNAFLAQLFIQFVAVVGAITNQIFWSCLDHVEVKTQVHQGEFMMVSGMRTDRQRQAVTIHNRHDFQTFTAFRRTDLSATTLGRGKGRIDKSLRFIESAFITQCVGQIGHGIVQYFIPTAVLRTPVDCFVVRVALRQHVPLCTRVENPEYGFEDFAGRYRIAAWAFRRNLFLRKVFPDAFSLFTESGRNTARATLGAGLAVSAFPRYVPV